MAKWAPHWLQLDGAHTQEGLMSTSNNTRLQEKYRRIYGQIDKAHLHMNKIHRIGLDWIRVGWDRVR